MFQLGILLLIVVAIVLRDSFFKEATRDFPTTVASTLDETEETSTNEPDVKLSVQRNETQSVAMESAQVQKVKPQAAAQKQAANTTTPVAAKPILQKNVSAKIYLAPRNQIETLLSRGQKIEDGVGFIPKEVFNQFVQADKQNWRQTDAMKKTFDLNKPKLLFMGERITETDQNIGFYFEVTVFDTTDLNNISFEIKVWNELKINGKMDDPITYEFVLPLQSLAIIGGIAPRDLTFNEDERALFESSSSLQILNNESFIEDYSDILLVLELN